ncbi:MAG: hypothetical protein JXR37_27030 [Kiritimatiellae bacterium]|nr:hypothetical protein [Kiritimatiellia bacterium]
MKTNKGLKKLWDVGKGSAHELVAQIGCTWDEVAADFAGIRADYRERIDGVLDEWARDETVSRLFEGFLHASKRGRHAAVSYLRARNRNLQEYLAKQVRLTPHLVGAVDGFLHVYLAMAPDRWTYSPRYRKGVRIGRVVGIACACTVFLPLSAGRAAIGLLPGASRAARYVAKQWQRAKLKRAARRAGGSARVEGATA